MAENDSTGLLGKKIFFLHPSVFIQNQLAAALAQDEFEVYLAKDEDKLARALKQYPDSIVFASIQEGMKEAAWETWVRKIQQDSATAGVQIGFIASAPDENLQRKFMGQFTPSCGYTLMRTDLAHSAKQITDILNTVNAKGRRKYIRAVMDRNSNITANLPINGTFITGYIRDISVVGFSCVFDADPELVKNTLFSDIQLRLQTQLIKAEGIVFGSRQDGDEKNYVLLLTQRTSPDVRAKIRKFMQTNLQAKMDSELK